MTFISERPSPHFAPPLPTEASSEKQISTIDEVAEKINNQLAKKEVKNGRIMKYNLPPTELSAFQGTFRSEAPFKGAVILSSVTLPRSEEQEGTPGAETENPLRLKGYAQTDTGKEIFFDAHMVNQRKFDRSGPRINGGVIVARQRLLLPDGSWAGNTQIGKDVSVLLASAGEHGKNVLNARLDDAQVHGIDIQRKRVVITLLKGK